MQEPVDAQVAVPDLVGLHVPVARDVGHDAAVVVVAANVDGPPLASLTWPGAWLVTSQEPVAGTTVTKWDSVHVTFRRADGDDAGDREPRLPAPDPDQLKSHAKRDE